MTGWFQVTKSMAGSGSKSRKCNRIFGQALFQRLADVANDTQIAVSGTAVVRFTKDGLQPRPADHDKPYPGSVCKIASSRSVDYVLAL